MSLKVDIRVNKHNKKSLFFLLLFRLSHFFTRNTFLKIIGFPIRLFYRIMSRNFMHLEIWDTMEIGEGFSIWHGAQSTVVNPATKIGKNVSLRQNTTLGSSSFVDNTLCPIIGDNVQVGPNCVIIGEIVVGNNVTVGAGAIVTKDIPDNAVVVGNPAKVIRIKENV